MGGRRQKKREERVLLSSTIPEETQKSLVGGEGKGGDRSRGEAQRLPVAEESGVRRGEQEDDGEDELTKKRKE